MTAHTSREVQRQYATVDPLKTRMETHRRYEERRVDLDAECRAALALAGDETLLDIGCGPGRFLLYLRLGGHTGRLLGLDQSAAMLAEGAAAANAAGVAFGWLRGDACAMPFRAGVAQRVVTRHMLYHVPDIPRALAECARVLRPDGQFLATTNARSSLPRIDALLDDLARAFSLPTPPNIAAPFCIENAPEQLRAAGFEVRETRIANALIFSTPEPIVAYAASILPTSDPRLRAEQERWLLAEARQRLSALGGVWRDPKDVGIYVAQHR
jgi:ubiquinone/menaquinone biosynthesis C-methylase UbiE